MFPRRGVLRVAHKPAFSPSLLEGWYLGCTPRRGPPSRRTQAWPQLRQSSCGVSAAPFHGAWPASFSAFRQLLSLLHPHLPTLSCVAWPFSNHGRPSPCICNFGLGHQPTARTRYLYSAPLHHATGVCVLWCSLCVKLSRIASPSGLLCPLCLKIRLLCLLCPFGLKEAMRPAFRSSQLWGAAGSNRPSCEPPLASPFARRYPPGLPARLLKLNKLQVFPTII